ncbi:MAG: flagellar brake protein [Ideonella sp. WA131b]|jgi:c-di-GMP-binding flagellar brake protein YcgR|nr:flagellar brake protein [Ideonella sp. WA131b]
MFEDTRPAMLDADGDEDRWGPFRVSQPQERLRLLRLLRDGQQPLVLSGPDGSSLTATLWSVDDTRRLLAFSAQDGLPALDRIVEADEGVAVAYMDSIKLQWELGGLLLVHGPRQASLQSQLPGSIYRFQRRTAYRVRTSARHAPVVRLRHPAMPEMALTLRVLDLSLGGCALWCPADVPGLEPGTRLGEVTVELDATTRFTTAATLAHVSGLGQHDGAVRVGCEWHKLPPVAERALQRWIDAAQRHRRLMARG